MKKFALRTAPFLAAWLLAFYMVPWVINLARYQDVQTYLYDQGLKMAGSENPTEAQQAPDALAQSIKIFMSQDPKTWSEKYFLPENDQELAGLAMFHIGNMLRQQGKVKEALGAYVQSLRFNAGQRKLIGVSARDDGMHQYGRDFCTSLNDKVAQARPVTGDDCQLARLEKEADDTRNNILSLLSEHPELAKMLAMPGELAGQGDGKGGQAVDGQQKGQVPGDKPAKDQGRNDNDAI